MAFTVISNKYKIEGLWIRLNKYFIRFVLQQKLKKGIFPNTD